MAIIIEQVDEDGTVVEFRFSDDMTTYSSFIKGTNKLHSFGDKPAVVVDGYKLWYKNGQQHRENDQPTVVSADGYKAWYKNGKYHRDNDQPAVIDGNGNKYWFKNGLIHRDNDKPAIVYANGDKSWYKNGKCIKEELNQTLDKKGKLK